MTMACTGPRKEEVKKLVRKKSEKQKEWKV
jgi:hypothetical protein